MAWSWDGYLVDGGARPDAITGMNPAFASALERMFMSAPPEVQQALRISSGYRSPERQAQLYAEALAKYGSPEAARKWVAPPGRSQHNHGNAADLRFLAPAAQEWVHANAGNFGLALPLGNEPWHIELATARSGGNTSGGPSMAGGARTYGGGGVLSLIGGGGGDDLSGGGALPPAVTAYQPSKAEAWWNARKGVLSDPDYRAQIAIAADALTVRPSESYQDMIRTRTAARKAREMDSQTRNMTAEWLAQNGRRDLAEAVLSGAVTGAEAANVFYRPPEQPAGDVQMLQYLMGQGMSLEDAMASMTGSGNDGTALMQNIDYLMQTQGLTFEQAMQALKDTSGGTTINTGERDTAFGKAMGAAQAKVWTDRIDRGSGATNTLGRLQIAEDLMKQGATGPSAAWGEWLKGVTGGLITAGGPAEAFTALMNREVLELQQMQAGPQTDSDAQRMASTLPQLANTPIGNQIILETARATANFQLEAARIANRVALGSQNPNDPMALTPEAGEQMIRDMPSPYAGVVQKAEQALAAMQQTGGQPTGQPQPSAGQQPGQPPVKAKKVEPSQWTPAEQSQRFLGKPPDRVMIAPDGRRAVVWDMDDGRAFVRFADGTELIDE